MDPRFRFLPAATAMLALAACAAGVLLLSGIPLRFDVLGPERTFSIQLGADQPISGGFLLLVGTVGLAAAIAGRRERSAAGDATVFAFVAGMAGVPLAENLFTFFLAWETMSVAPGLLLILDSKEEARRAGVLYLIYAHLSAVALLVGFILWGHGITLRLEDLLALPLPVAAACFLLGGCLTKAGIMPFHTWLPEAHPQAPSHVSALMSGAMVALPAYVVARFVLPVHVPAPLALTVLLLAALSAALGALHGLHARNIKRVLAFTTIAHMGVVFALLGLGMLLASTGTESVRAFIVPSVVVYVLSHGWSKGAHFLVAGEVHHATGELDLERLGGLRRTLGPLGALSALASLGLAGLPPTAGFGAELAALATLLAALPMLQPFDGVLVLGSLFLLAIGAGAGLAAVAKITFGVFHGPLRSEAKAAEHVSVVGPAILIGLSLLVGLAPGLLWSGLMPTGADPWSILTPLGSFAFVPLLGMATLATGILLLAARPTFRKPRAVPVWACGLPPPGPRQTYTSDALVMPYRILFAEILRPKSDLRLQEAPVAPFAPFKGQYEESQTKYVEPWIHAPLLRVLLPPIERLRRLHRGAVQLYLTIALLVLVALLYLLPVIP